AVIGTEEERIIDDEELTGITTAWSGIDVLNHDRAGRRAVGLPKLLPVGAIVCCEKDLSIDFREVEGEGIAWSRVDICYHDGAGRRAIGLPKLTSMYAIICSEVKHPVKDPERVVPTGDGPSQIRVRASRTRVDVTHQDRPRSRSIALPEFCA